MKTLGAFTETSNYTYYPSYINVSETDYGSIKIIVRPTSVGNVCSNPVEIVLTRKDAMRLFTEIFSEMIEK